MKNLLFIINPISGTGNKSQIEKEIFKSIDLKKNKIEITYTKYKFHASELTKEAVDRDFDSVIVVGGDGTINEAGRGLIGTNTALGVIPAGSGNGLAYNFNIPRNFISALELINHFKIKKIDTGLVNNIPFLCMAGLGFDAHIARLFADYGKRGFSSYLRLSIREFAFFKNRIFNIDFEDGKINKEAFLINICNISYYGNNAVIAPKAIPDDGLLDLCILKKFPPWALPGLVFHLFWHSIDKSEFYEGYQSKNLRIKNLGGPVQIDGEFYDIREDLEFSVNPLSLGLIVP